MVMGIGPDPGGFLAKCSVGFVVSAPRVPVAVVVVIEDDVAAMSDWDSIAGSVMMVSCADPFMLG